MLPAGVASQGFEGATVAQAVLFDAGVQFPTEGVSCYDYDYSAGVLHVAVGNTVRTYALGGSAEGSAGGSPPEPLVTDVGEGPPVAALQASPDGRLLCLQRSPNQLQFVDRTSGNIFIQGPRARTAVKGFFWAEAGECAFVMVTPEGLELYALQAGHQGLRHLETRRHPATRWHSFSQDTCMLMLATIDVGLWLQAYQFSRRGIIKLPPLQLAATVPSEEALGERPAGVAPECIRMLSIYGRVYCCFNDRRSRRLYLYRAYKDQIKLWHRCEVYSEVVQLSVVDNVLLVHHPDKSVVMLLDICALRPGQLVHPITNPLPLAIAPGPSQPPTAPLRQVSDRLYGRWRFELPRLVVDLAAGRALICSIDVPAIVRSCSDWPALVAFLQRRRPSAHPKTDLKALTLSVIKGVLVERLPMATVRRVFDAVNAAHADWERTARRADGTAAAAAAGAVVVGPDQMAEEVLQWLHDEEAVEAQYLQAVLTEYIASAEVHSMALPARLHILALDVAMQQGQESQVVFMLATQPALDSPQLAARLDALAASGQLPQGRQLALDMLARLGLHLDLCRGLLADGQVFKALKVARQHGVDAIPTAEFLEVAAATKDAVLFTAVYRFCNERVHTFFPDYEDMYSKYFGPEAGVAAET